MAKTTVGRLSDLEATLSPTQLVVRWLDEAHAFGGFVAYVESLLDGPKDQFPLNRLLREASEGVRSTGRKGADQDGAMRRALRETAFRFQLVLAINTSTQDLVEKELLYNVIVSSQFGLYLSDGGNGTPRLEPDHFAQTVRIAEWRVTELRAQQEATRSVEARFLGGHPAAFPDVSSAFDERLAEAEHTLGLALRLAEIDEVAVPDLVGPDGRPTRAEEIATDLVEPARSTALEKLGEGREALGIATGWVRGRFARTGVDVALPRD